MSETASAERLFKFTVQSEPFGTRRFIAGRHPAHLKIVPLKEATQYREDELSNMIRKVKNAVSSDNIITVL